MRQTFFLMLGLIGMFTGCQRSAPIPQYISVPRQEYLDLRNTLAEGASDGGGPAVVKADPKGWGTLSGTFRVSNPTAIPAPTPLNVTADKAYCTQGGVPKSQRFVVDSATGGLKNVVLFLADDIPETEPWTHPNMAPGKNDIVEFDQKNCVFLTHVLAMQVSQPMKILNSDEVGHNTKLENSGKAFNQTIAAGSGELYQHTKQERAPYPANCSIHPWMSAYIMPRNNSYFAVTDEKGQFTIENVPAEVDLTFKAWQESAKFFTMVTVNGKKETWPRRGFTVKLTDGGEEKLDVQVDAAALGL